VTFYVSSNSGSTWTQLGSPVIVTGNGAGAGTHVYNTDLVLGSAYNNTLPLDSWILRATILVGTTTVFDADFRSAPVGATTFTDATGHASTINDAVILPVNPSLSVTVSVPSPAAVGVSGTVTGHVTGVSLSTVYIGVTRNNGLSTSLVAATVSGGAFTAHITPTVNIANQQVAVYYDSAGAIPLGFSAGFAPTPAPTGSFTPIPRLGVDVSGGEFSDPSAPHYPPLSDIDYYHSVGMNVIRLPFLVACLFPGITARAIYFCCIN
jgi:hypothetical protein